MSEDLTLAIQAARLAGDLIRSDFENVKAVKKKGVNDFVTDTDLKAERLIIEHLKKSGYSVLGEETGETNNQTEKKWIIDPIDGTSNFIREIPFFAVSIALIEDNNLLLGVVYDPIADDCYSAEKDKFAYMNGRKISVSNRAMFDGTNILLEHNRSKKSVEDFVKVLTRLLEQDDGPVVLRQGSTALMLCYVAKGRAEAFLSAGDEIYDYAAGLIIAKEAGAIISDWKGNEWDNSNSYILASNPGLNDKILKRLKGIQ